MSLGAWPAGEERGPAAEFQPWKGRFDAGHLGTNVGFAAMRGSGGGGDRGVRKSLSPGPDSGRGKPLAPAAGRAERAPTREAGVAIPDVQQNQVASFVDLVGGSKSASFDSPLTPPMRAARRASEEAISSSGSVLSEGSPSPNQGARGSILAGAGGGASAKVGEALSRFSNLYFGDDDVSQSEEQRASPGGETTVHTGGPGAAQEARGARPQDQRKGSDERGDGPLAETRKELMTETKRRVLAERHVEELKMELKLIKRKIREEAYEQAIKFVEQEYIALAEPTLKLEQRAALAERALEASELRAVEAEKASRRAQDRLEVALRGSNGSRSDTNQASIAELEEVRMLCGQLEVKLKESLEREKASELRAELLRKEALEAAERGARADEERERAVGRMLSAVSGAAEASSKVDALQKEMSRLVALRERDAVEFRALIDQAQAQIAFLTTQTSAPPAPISGLSTPNRSSGHPSPAKGTPSTGQRVRTASGGAGGARGGAGEKGATSQGVVSAEGESCMVCGREGQAEGRDGDVLCESCFASHGAERKPLARDVAGVVAAVAVTGGAGGVLSPEGSPSKRDGAAVAKAYTVVEGVVKGSVDEAAAYLKQQGSAEVMHERPAGSEAGGGGLHGGRSGSEASIGQRVSMSLEEFQEEADADDGRSTQIPKGSTSPKKGLITSASPPSFSSAASSPGYSPPPSPSKPNKSPTSPSKTPAPPSPTRAGAEEAMAVARRALHEAQRKRAEEEAQRKRAEEEEKEEKEKEEERKRIVSEEQKKRAEEVVRRRREAEEALERASEETRRRVEESQKQRREAEEALQRAEETQQRRVEEAQRRREAEEGVRLAMEEDGRRQRRGHALSEHEEMERPLRAGDRGLLRGRGPPEVRDLPHTRRAQGSKFDFPFFC